MLNEEETAFFNLISERIQENILDKNKFINVSIEKGCMAKVAGCWEHTSLVWDGLETTISDKSNNVAVWMDIPNAYGSVPHQLFSLPLNGRESASIRLKSY